MGDFIKGTASNKPTGIKRTYVDQFDGKYEKKYQEEIRVYQE